MPRAHIAVSTDPIIALKLNEYARVRGETVSHIVERLIARELGLLEVLGLQEERERDEREDSGPKRASGR